MARRFLKPGLAMVVCLCLSPASHAAEHELKTNPFARSVEVQAQAPASPAVAEALSVPFVLRGTMVAGQRSLANISGVVVSLGEEINGYKLVDVRQREVVLQRQDDRRVLTVDQETEGDL